MKVSVCLIVIVVFTKFTHAQSYHGILINGPSGTQLYDPFDPSHNQGNMRLGLQSGNTQTDGSGVAVINGRYAYFAGGERCECVSQVYARVTSSNVRQL